MAEAWCGGAQQRVEVPVKESVPSRRPSCPGRSQSKSRSTFSSRIFYVGTAYIYVGAAPTSAPGHRLGGTCTQGSSSDVVAVRRASAVACPAPPRMPARSVSRSTHTEWPVFKVVLILSSWLNETINVWMFILKQMLLWVQRPARVHAVLRPHPGAPRLVLHQGVWYDWAPLLAVRRDNKQRFSLLEEDGELLIRANQGHTVIGSLFRGWRPKSDRPSLVDKYAEKDCNVIRVSEIQKVLDIADERSLIDTIFFCYLGCNASAIFAAKVVDNGVRGGELAAQPGDEAIALVDEPGDGLGHGGAGGRRGDDGGGGGHRRASLTTAGRRIAQPAMPRFLQENPEYVAQGVTLAQFSFQIPRPLRQDYVKKKPKLINASDEASTITSKSSEPDEVNPIAWAVPTKHEGDASEEASLADETLASEVIDASIVYDPWTREIRMFGFVTMAATKEADHCIKYLDCSVLQGQCVSVFTDETTISVFNESVELNCKNRNCSILFECTNRTQQN
ncbi:Methyl-CpG-binding domain-containing protein 2 [Zea mays]|uniref:Methyl-CpG-binding domain-containing protein 2 n=1 Tax=Zea mays TaxID=4577 RepID=A0A3L6E776_MAIZE|nr:Methyl-CpG-binding domain-containing protein 2 [Zea mays]